MDSEIQPLRSKKRQFSSSDNLEVALAVEAFCGQEGGKQDLQGCIKSPKRACSRRPKRGYNGLELFRHESSVFESDELLQKAASQMAEYIHLQRTDDKRRFIFSFFLPWTYDIPTISLTVLKGSIFTFVWSLVARFDDEYLLEAVSCLTPETSDSSPTLLWSMKGLESNYLGVESSDVDWNMLRLLQGALRMQYIGLYSFAKLLTKFVLELPPMEKESTYIEPQPATLMSQSMFKLTRPCELVGFTEEEMTSCDYIKNLISPLVKADGSGVVLPYFFPEKLHSTDPLTGSQYWDPYCVRVLEVRKCPTLARNSSAVLLLGTCADKFPHVRFVCLDVNEVREYVINHGDMTEISAANILTRQEWDAAWNAQGSLISSNVDVSYCWDLSNPPPYDRQKSGGLSFTDCSEWGSELYYSTGNVNVKHTPFVSTQVADQESNDEGGAEYADMWHPGETLYTPAPQWLDRSDLSAINCTDAAENVFLKAYVKKRTSKQVTLILPALGKEYKRGLTFMKKYTVRAMRSTCALLSKDDIAAITSKKSTM